MMPRSCGLLRHRPTLLLLPRGGDFNIVAGSTVEPFPGVARLMPSAYGQVTQFTPEVNISASWLRPNSLVGRNFYRIARVKMLS